ncbi:MAG: hypothetical protein OET90_00510 [Desulfuromonadales bacterium]|nr:hypothetical protein [Desulfuromonadales bacterium]
MTHAALEQYIQNFNSGEWDTPCHQFSIGENVNVALIWYQVTPENVTCDKSNRFYFVTDEGLCVAVVFEMSDLDIHWFVLEEHREKGLLHKALHETILPYIFSDNRREQRATADSTENERYLLRQGFEKREDNGSSAFYLTKDKIREFDDSAICREPLSDADCVEIKNKLRLIVREVRIIKDRLECSHGKSGPLEDIAKELGSFAFDVKDLGT